MSRKKQVEGFKGSVDALAVNALAGDFFLTEYLVGLSAVLPVDAHVR